MATEQIHDSECVGNCCKESVISNTPPPLTAYNSPASGHVAARVYHINPVSKKTLAGLNCKTGVVPKTRKAKALNEGSRYSKTSGTHETRAKPNFTT